MENSKSVCHWENNDYSQILLFTCFLFFVYSFFSLFFLFTFVHLWWLVVVCSSSVRYESDCVPCKYVPSIEWVENECQGCSDDFVSCHRRQFHFEIFKFKQQRAGRFVEIHWYQSQYYYWRIEKYTHVELVLLKLFKEWIKNAKKMCGSVGQETINKGGLVNVLYLIAVQCPCTRALCNTHECASMT